MNYFPGGVWPVMVTPFTDDNMIDEDGVKSLVEWYISKRVDGIFAVCQSSEMFYLSLEERVSLAKLVKKTAGDRVPVIASGHISDSIEDQIKELNEVAKTGVDAVILITNRMAKEDESDDIWIENTERIISQIPENVKLGLYECPYPYKRVMSEKTVKWAVESGRFYFLKDTSCDIKSLEMKIRIANGSHLKIYNANTATLLQSLKIGAYGYCGVMANMHPQLYSELYDSFEHTDRETLEAFLSMSALIERQCYPVNAKFYLQLENVEIGLHTRTKNEKELTETFKLEVQQLKNLSDLVEDMIFDGRQKKV